MCGDRASDPSMHDLTAPGNLRPASFHRRPRPAQDWRMTMFVIASRWNIEVLERRYQVRSWWRP